MFSPCHPHCLLTLSGKKKKSEGKWWEAPDKTVIIHRRHDRLLRKQLPMPQENLTPRPQPHTHPGETLGAAATQTPLGWRSSPSGSPHSPPLSTRSTHLSPSLQGCPSAPSDSPTSSAASSFKALQGSAQVSPPRSLPGPAEPQSALSTSRSQSGLALADLLRSLGTVTGSGASALPSGRPQGRVGPDPLGRCPRDTDKPSKVGVGARGCAHTSVPWSKCVPLRAPLI